MKFWLNILILFFFSEYFVFAQGFDWQYHSRLPYKNPNKFVGFQVELSQNSVVGEFGFAESDIKCCNFESGIGSSIGFSAIGEYWLKGNLSVGGSIAIISTSTSFSKSIQVPRSNGNQDWTAVYRYKMEESHNYLEITPQLKYRLGWKYISVNVKLSNLIILGNSANFTESIANPDFEYFIDGSKEREILNAQSPDYNQFLIAPYFGLTYDQPIALNYYGSISLGTSIPVMSLVKNQDYREWKASVTISIYRAILQ